MANGSLVVSLGIWNGTLEWGPLCVHTSFKVFPSGGSWRMLMGKLLLEQIKAFQDYGLDSITVHVKDKSHQFHNFSSFHPLPSPSLPTAISFPDVTQFAPPPGNWDPPDTSSALVTSPDQTHDVVVIEAPESLIGDVFVLQTVDVDHNIFTRLTEKGPFYPLHIQKIVDSIVVGSLEPHELQEVHDLVAEFADVFALSVKEVKPVTHIKY